jgi:hypothetical protein
MAASVGIHGLLFVLLPMLPSNSFEPGSNEQRTVDLIELTPNELSRLPDLSGPTVPTFPLMPELEAEDPEQSDLFMFPEASPRTSILPVPPSQPFFLPPTSSFPFAIEQSPPRTIPQPQPPVSTPPPTVQSPVSPTEPRPEEAPPVVGSLRALPDLQAINPVVPPGEVPLEELEESGNPEDLAQGSADPPSDTLMAEQARLRELFTFKQEGTTEEEANLAFSTWFLEEHQQDRTLRSDERLTIDAEYNVAACRVLERIRTEPQRLKAIYGVIVEPDGQLAEEPRLVLSSGFEYFNQKALEAIATYEFPQETGEDHFYLVDVRFEYSEEQCPAPALPADAPAG